jgi:hypothetical protein
MEKYIFYPDKTDPNPASYPMGTGRSSSVDKAAGA